MASIDEASIAALHEELDRLEKRERAVSAERRRLHERIARFPSEHSIRREAEISAERGKLHRQIAELKARIESDRQSRV